MNTKPKFFPTDGLKLMQLANELYVTAFNGGVRVGVVVPEQELAKLRRDAAELRRREAA